jgi:hypothetical protein
MAASIIIEEERGTCSGSLHPHNGYYAGDFDTGTQSDDRQPSSALGDR